MEETIDRIEKLDLSDNDTLVIFFKEGTSKEDILEVTNTVKKSVSNKVFAFSSDVEKLEVINQHEEAVAKGSD